MSSKKKIAILGSTGSIGSTSLKIINLKLSKYKIELLCAKENTKLLFRQIKQYLPRYVLISDYKSFIFLKKKNIKKK